MIRAILYSVLIFIVLFYLLQLGSNYLASNSNDFLSWITWLIILAYGLYLFSGFIAGMLSRSFKFITGGITGLISALSAILIYGVGIGGGVNEYLIVLILGLGLGLIGGGIAKLIE